MNKGIIVISVLLTIFLIPIVSGTNYYETNFYNYETSNPSTLFTPSFYSYSTNNCTVTLQNYVDLVTYDYAYLSNIYQSPQSITIGTGNYNYSGNLTCYSQGAASTTSNYNNDFEAKTLFTRSGGINHSVTLNSKIECYTDNDWINISSGFYINDSRGYGLNGYFVQGFYPGAVFVRDYIVDSNNFTECAGIDGKYMNGQTWTGGSGSGNPGANFVYPFTTGETGYIEYEINNVGYFTPLYYGYFELTDPAGSYIQFATSSGSLTLSPNTDYAIYIGGLASSATHPNPDLNLSIFIYSPDWVCGPYSDCVDGIKSRTCTDPLGKVPANIEYQTCIDIPEFELLLGFEDSKEMYAFKCSNILWPACPIYLANKTTHWPTEWTVYNPYYDDFLDMVSETATEGTRSLKMWYIPPTGYLPKEDGPPPTDCKSDIEEGRFPIINHGTNASIFIEYNITFPTPYMTVMYDVKRCTENPSKTNTWCTNECYGNCTSEPNGEYLFRVQDIDGGNGTLLDYEDNAPLEWDTRYIDLSDLNLQPNTNYSLVFAINPFDKYDQDGHCIYFDNVRIQVRGSVLTCEESTCVGYDYYIPERIGDACIYEISYDDYRCLPEDVRQQNINKEDYCIDLTLYQWDPETLEWFTTENSSYCEELEIEQGIYDPINLVEPYQETAEEYGLGWTFGFLTPIFLALFISLIISAGLVYYVKPKDHNGIIFLVSFMGMLTVMSLVGLFPGWLLVVLIIISSILGARMFTGQRNG